MTRNEQLINFNEKIENKIGRRIIKILFDEIGRPTLLSVIIHITQ